MPNTIPAHLSLRVLLDRGGDPDEIVRPGYPGLLADLVIEVQLTPACRRRHEATRMRAFLRTCPETLPRNTHPYPHVWPWTLHPLGRHMLNAWHLELLEDSRLLAEAFSLCAGEASIGLAHYRRGSRILSLRCGR